MIEPAARERQRGDRKATRMPSMTFMGIPREIIPWQPMVTMQCNGCGRCVEDCARGVFEMDEARRVARVIAPRYCVVLCDRCAPLCPTQAILFPDKDRTKAWVRELLSR